MSPAPAAPMLILIAEDDPLAGLTLLEELRALGHTTVGPYFSAMGAVQAAEAVRPNMAIVDVTLVGSHDGLWAARRLKAMGVPAVLASGAAVDAVAAAAVAVGFLAEPFGRDALTRAIRAVEAPQGEGVPDDTSEGFHRYGAPRDPGAGAAG